MARKRRKQQSDQSSASYAFRELAQTQELSRSQMTTQIMDRGADSPLSNSTGSSSPEIAELSRSIHELAAKIGVSVGGGGGVGGSGGGGGGGSGGSPGAMGGGASSPPPPALNVSAAQNYLKGLAVRQEAGGPLGQALTGKLGGAAGAVVKVLNKFAGEVGHSIGNSPLEVSPLQAAKEHGIDPGRFTESALGFADQAGIPGAGLIEGLAKKANADSDARSGRTAIKQARTRLADIAGGLARRGGTFSDSQLLSAHHVLQEREQRELNVRQQIRGLEDGFGAQRSGLGSGGHAR